MGAYRLIVRRVGELVSPRSVADYPSAKQPIARLGGGLAMTAPSRGYQQFEPVYHHYGPHKAGLPPLVPYFRELWHRRTFSAELSKASMRGANTTTFFGQAWLIINPLLLAAVWTSFFRFLPTVPVYVVFHLILLPGVWHPRMILSLYFLGTLVVFSMGLAAFFAALQVYFRDTSNFLPYFVRIWMYLSPVLWLPESIARLPRAVLTIIKINPMYSMLGGYTELIQEGTIPDLYMWLTSAAWALGVAAIGFLFFISREREFAVRLN